MQAYHSAASVGRTVQWNILPRGLSNSPHWVQQELYRSTEGRQTTCHILDMALLASPSCFALPVTASVFHFWQVQAQFILKKTGSLSKYSNIFTGPELPFVFGHRAHLLGYFLWTEEPWNEKHPSFDTLLIKKFKYKHKCLWPNSEHMKTRKGIDRSVFIK